MAKRVFKSALSIKQVEKNFAETDFFAELHSGLTEAVSIASGKSTPAMVHHRNLPVVNVVQVRQSLSMTQRAFANVLGVSVRTVESWEAGKSNPTPTAKKLIHLIQSDPTIVKKLQ